MIKLYFLPKQFYNIDHLHFFLFVRIFTSSSPSPSNNPTFYFLYISYRLSLYF